MSESDNKFPVNSEDVRNIAGCPRFFPWDELAKHEQQALDNHDQTLKRLAERGGLGLTEIHCIMHDKPWTALVSDATALEYVDGVIARLSVKREAA